MMRAALAALLFAPAIAAGAPSFQFPADCALGETCFVQNLVDHDSSADAQDFLCAGFAYDGHKGTDIRLPTLADMAGDVPVLAAAGGVVLGLRNDMPDTGVAGTPTEALQGRECGNGVVLDHGDGWHSQYCHLKQGSVSVATGDVVKAGQPLGAIGLSGLTEFPHVHFAVRQNGDVVDPYDPDGEITCGSPSNTTLWQERPAIASGALLEVGFADKVPEYDDVRAGTAGTAELPGDAPALVIWGFLANGRKGDVVALRIDGPMGELHEHTVLLKRNQAQLFRASGRKLSGLGWPGGTYTGTVQVIRKKRVISEKTTTLTIR